MILIEALRWLLQCYPEAPGPLIAATSGVVVAALPAYDQRTLRIGAYRCRWHFGRKTSWP